MIRTVTIAVGAFLGLAVCVAIGQTIQSGGGSAVGIVTACTAGNGQLLYSNGGSCGGTTGVTYSSALPNRITAGQFFGSGFKIQLDDTNSSVGLGPATAISFGSTNSAGTYDSGISRNTAGVIAIGNGTAGNHAGGYVTGTASLTSLTTGTNADFLCLAADGTVLLQNAACTISSLRFKPDWKPYQYDALSKVSQMDVGTFHLSGSNRDPNSQSLQAGLSAESVAAIAPECAVYEDDMKTPKSYRQECVIALLVKAIQQLKAK